MLAVAVLVFPATVEAAFPGANGKIVFVRAEGPGHNDIWTIDPDGSAEVNITNTPSVSEFHPSWSADGSQIAFMRGGAIWVMNQDGFGQHEVVPAPTNPTCPPGTSLSGSGLLNPAWSPDGSKLVFPK